MNYLSPTDPLAQVLRQLAAPEASASQPAGEVSVESLPSSRQVLRFTFPEGNAVVGKFFSAYPPQTSADLSLAREYDSYCQLPALGFNNGESLMPQLLGRWPQGSLGLLLEAIPGPDLDQLIHLACDYQDAAALEQGLQNLTNLLAFFHSRPVSRFPVSSAPALAYFDKVVRQLQDAGLLTLEDCQTLIFERTWWENRFKDFTDMQVLVHGDATPTNFLFPNGRAVALDLERLRFGDRLWDLSWMAGELKHAWGWRINNLEGAEAFIRKFFLAYLAEMPPEPSLAERLYGLNPFYMALAELRIARNTYLSFDYRRKLVSEARCCLAGGRRL